MPSLEENRGWSTYEWKDAGDEWSQAWGDSAQLWHGTLLPRIYRYLPASHVLEIAPGHGRCTQFLRQHADRLSVVDLVPECIEACRRRFAGDRRIAYHVNDGATLPMIATNSVDFAFSWDSLVHVEADVMSSYLRELARVLVPGGVAFLHHSNLGAFLDPKTGKPAVSAEHWRGRTVTAEGVRRACTEQRLHCKVQELVPWGGVELIDCWSLARKPLTRSETAPETQVVERRDFQTETDLQRKICSLYGMNGPRVLENDRATAVGSIVSELAGDLGSAIRRAVRRGYRQVSSRWPRIGDRVDR